MSREIIGPALPPGYRSREKEEEEEKDDDVAGPVLPPGYKCVHSSESSDDSEQDSSPPPWHHKGRPSTQERTEAKRRKQSPSPAASEDEDDGFFGPALPPGFMKQTDSPDRLITGPALPPSFRNIDLKSEDDGGNSGSSNPPGFKEKAGDSSEDEDVIGPLPAKGPVQSSVAEDFERRARKMKQKLTVGDDDGSKQPARESWMTELPPELTGFVLGPRTFKRRAGEKSGDRTAWTDTPADKERKAEEKQEAKVSTSKSDEKAPLSERDKRLADQVSTYNVSVIVKVLSPFAFTLKIKVYHKRGLPICSPGKVPLFTLQSFFS
ncbi:hypothetical protein FKM82_009188 [Ascaphus truei]